MESSDEDFLPDPERHRVSQGSSLKRKKRPPDRREDDNKQSGLKLHDDFMKGRSSEFNSDPSRVSNLIKIMSSSTRS